MKKILFLLFFLSGLSAHAQDATGKWHGRAIVGVQSLRISFDIRHDGNGWSGAMQSPDQSGEWIPLSSVDFRNDTLKIVVTRIGFSYTGKVGGQTIEGSFTQMGNTFPLNLSRQEIVLNRPQEPRPKYPYDVEDVAFRNETAGIALAGTLTLPRAGKKPFPAVILVSGSGPQDRDESLAGHKPFRVIADRLTQNGIAVLRYDDRGTAGSGGDYGSAAIADFAGDALAGIGYLRARPEIAAGKVGLIGHSEGGMIALMLAAERQADFIVTLAGPGVDGKKLLNMQRSALLKASGAPDSFIEPYNRKMNEAVEAVLTIADKNELRETLTAIFAGTPLASGVETVIAQLASPEIRSFLRYDPAGLYPAIECSVLALNGEKDLQVPAGPNLEAIREGLAHNPDVTIKAYPGLNHLFQTAQTGLPAEYGQIEETFAPAVLKEMADWILKRTE